MTRRSLAFLLLTLALSAAAAGPLAAQQKKSTTTAKKGATTPKKGATTTKKAAAPPKKGTTVEKPDSVRVTLLASGQRYEVVADEGENSMCSAARVPRDGTDRMTGTMWPGARNYEAGVGLTLVRETSMPICSYKRSGGTSVGCMMRLTGRQSVNVNLDERTDAEHGLHLLLHWTRVDSIPPTAKVDVGSCLPSRNEQADGDLTGPMADAFREAYVGRGNDGIPNGEDVIFPLARPGWVKAPVPLKSADGRYVLQISR